MLLNSSKKHLPETVSDKRVSFQKFRGIAWLAGIVVLIWIVQGMRERLPHQHDIIDTPAYSLPLAMSGGNPYIRALMRTISASESDGRNAYALLYGGSHVHDLSQHPDQCLPIEVGVNKGLCSTAAGRYQFLTPTWQEKSNSYHPDPFGVGESVSYSFLPEYQDEVMYRWLTDHHKWEIDILTLLEEDRAEEVLAHLSGVWTSLGSGIEDNENTPYLPTLYRKFLAEELASG